MPEYDLEAISHPAHGPVVVGSPPCTGCGYNLDGLPLTGVCPECGKPVELSLRGELLRYASPAFVRAVDLGLTLILTAILAYAALWIASIVISIFARSTLYKFTGLDLLVQGLMLLPSGLFILGYWKFTTPDPGFTGRERPNSARIVARTAACVSTAAKLGSVIFKLAASSIGGGLPTVVLGGLLWILDIAAWATLYFAMALYVRWVARRIPDQAVISQARTYFWLLPVLFIVGAPFCGLGPLIALILYATMLQSLRARTKEVLDWQQRGGQYLST